MIKKLFLGTIIIIIFLASLITSFDSPECTTTELVDTSISVERSYKKVIGFNTESDSLKFGKVSPSSSVKRSINVQYNRDANVIISAEGDFARWIDISPNSFFLQGGSNKEIIFTALVPKNSMSGDFFGKVRFCFKE